MTKRSDGDGGGSDEALRKASDSTDISIETLALKRLRALLQPLDPPGKLLRLPIVFERICAVFCLNKKEAWAVLRSLEARGLIDIVPYQGIRIAPREDEPLADRTGEPGWRPTTSAQRRVLRHLRTHQRAYPSDIARALDLDIDTVMSAARRLQRSGLINA